ncbi:MAG: hypothetical protein AVDCRST_MAG54-4866, partial [uncultured Actinomycetospora sp.]
VHRLRTSPSWAAGRGARPGAPPAPAPRPPGGPRPPARSDHRRRGHRGVRRPGLPRRAVRLRHPRRPAVRAVHQRPALDGVRRDRRGPRRDRRARRPTRLDDDDPGRLGVPRGRLHRPGPAVDPVQPARLPAAQRLLQHRGRAGPAHGGQPRTGDHAPAGRQPLPRRRRPAADGVRRPLRQRVDARGPPPRSPAASLHPGGRARGPGDGPRLSRAGPRSRGRGHPGAARRAGRAAHPRGAPRGVAELVATVL